MIGTGDPVEFEQYLPDPFDYWAEARVFDDEAGLSVHSRDITTRKQSEHRLKTQRNTLEVLNRLLRHDLRNDLQVATGYFDLLIDDADVEVAHTETIQASLDHAVELTLTARRITETIAKDANELQQVRLDDVLREEVNHIRDIYPDATVLIEGALAATTVLVDQLLDSVSRNLMKNAIEHNDKSKPEVRLTLTTDETTATVTVADNGPGIPEAMRESIFEQGQMGEVSKGTGIGLYLVQTLIDNYDGTAEIEDNNPTGTRMIITLPRVDT